MLAVLEHEVAVDEDVLDSVRRPAGLVVGGVRANVRRVEDHEVRERAHAHGAAVWACTVNEPEEAARLAEIGTDAIITDDPLIVRGSASRPFDGEGVTGKRLVMIEDGVLKHWFLSTSTAREIGGLKTNGRGARGGTSVSPSSSNLALEPGDISPEELIRNIGNGFYVTELIGQGVNMITGEYSRGATGFWIENGELTFAVSEVTIASNLKDMFMRVTPANDIDRDFSVAAPTLAIEGMTLAGR